jgi:anti-sigma regulatory factor (Ser/Thr protein kinase)
MTNPDLSPGSPAGSGWTDAPQVVDVDQPFAEDGLYQLRATVTAHAVALGADPVLVEKVLIVASELATNAVRHGGGAGRLRLWRTGALLALEVTDAGAGMPDVTVGSAPPDRSAPGGRGMWICRRLVTDLRIASGNGGTTVTAVFHLDGR